MPLTPGQEQAVHEMARTWVAALLKHDVVPYLIVGLSPDGNVTVATIPREMGDDEQLLAMLGAAAASIRAAAYDEKKVPLENL